MKAKILIGQGRNFQLLVKKKIQHVEAADPDDYMKRAELCLLVVRKDRLV